MGKLVAPHMTNIEEIAEFNGYSDRNSTRVCALARAYRKMGLGKREHVEDVVAGLEEQAERIKGIGGAYASRCINYLSDAKSAVLRNHEDLLSAENTSKKDTAGLAGLPMNADKTYAVREEGPFGSRDDMREDGRLVTG